MKVSISGLASYIAGAAFRLVFLRSGEIHAHCLSHDTLREEVSLG